MKYVIKISDKGYYGKLPWTPVPIEDAIVFTKMKDARRILNRLNGRLIGHDAPAAEIELKL